MALPLHPGQFVKIDIAAGDDDADALAAEGFGVLQDRGQRHALEGSITIFMRFQISFIASTISGSEAV
jgi:hypothetical protein